MQYASRVLIRHFEWFSLFFHYWTLEPWTNRMRWSEIENRIRSPSASVIQIYFYLIWTEATLLVTCMAPHVCICFTVNFKVYGSSLQCLQRTSLFLSLTLIRIFFVPFNFQSVVVFLLALFVTVSLFPISRSGSLFELFFCFPLSSPYLSIFAFSWLHFLTWIETQSVCLV